jgi:hypothetical protein
MTHHRNETKYTTTRLACELVYYSSVCYILLSKNTEKMVIDALFYSLQKKGRFTYWIHDDPVARVATGYRFRYSALKYMEPYCFALFYWSRLISLSLLFFFICQCAMRWASEYSGTIKRLSVQRLAAWKQETNTNKIWRQKLSSIVRPTHQFVLDQTQSSLITLSLDQLLAFLLDDLAGPKVLWLQELE